MRTTLRSQQHGHAAEAWSCGGSAGTSHFTPGKRYEVIVSKSCQHHAEDIQDAVGQKDRPVLAPRQGQPLLDPTEAFIVQVAGEQLSLNLTEILPALFLHGCANQ